MFNLFQIVKYLLTEEQPECRELSGLQHIQNSLKQHGILEKNCPGLSPTPAIY